MHKVTVVAMHGISPLQEAMRDDQIKINFAYNLCKLHPTQQAEIVRLAKVSLKEARKRFRELTTPESGLDQPARDFADIFTIFFNAAEQLAAQINDASLDALKEANERVNAVAGLEWQVMRFPVLLERMKTVLGIATDAPDVGNR